MRNGHSRKPPPKPSSRCWCCLSPSDEVRRLNDEIARLKWENDVLRSGGTPDASLGRSMGRSPSYKTLASLANGKLSPAASPRVTIMDADDHEPAHMTWLLEQLSEHQREKLQARPDSFKVVDLSRVRLEKAELNHVVGLLNQASGGLAQLQQLVLAECQLRPPAARRLAEGLRLSETLRSLDLKSNALSDRGKDPEPMCRLAGAIGRGAALSKVDLSSNGFCQQYYVPELDLRAEVVAASTSAYPLGAPVDASPGGPRTAPASPNIAGGRRAMQTSSGTLDGPPKGLKRGSRARVAAREVAVVKPVDAEGEVCVQDITVILCLGAALNEPECRLRELRLADNELGVAGARALCDSLKTSPPLQHLDVASNRLGPEGCQLFLSALLTNTSLGFLSLADNNLCDLERRSSIFSLSGTELGGASATRACVKVLLEAVRTSRGLKTLVLAENNLQADHQAQLKKANSERTKASKAPIEIDV